MSNHGLTPVRPRTTPLEATILDELRDLRERVGALEAERDRRRVEAQTRCSCLDDMNDPDRKRKCERHGVEPFLRVKWAFGS